MLIRWWGLQQVAQEDGFAGYDQFLGFQTIENLPPAAPLLPNLERPLREMTVVGRHPSRHGAIPLANNGIDGDGRRFAVFANANREGGDHAGAQLVLWVGNLGARGYPMGVRIDGRADCRDLARKSPLGIGHHPDLNRLSDLNCLLQLPLGNSLVVFIELPCTRQFLVGQLRFAVVFGGKF